MKRGPAGDEFDSIETSTQKESPTPVKAASMKLNLEKLSSPDSHGGETKDEGGDGGVSMPLYKVLRGPHDWISIEDDGVETDQLIWDFLSAHDQSGAL